MNSTHFIFKLKTLIGKLLKFLMYIYVSALQKVGKISSFWSARAQCMLGLIAGICGVHGCSRCIVGNIEETILLKIRV